MACTDCCNREVPPPEDIAEFRKVMHFEENFVIPEIPEKRKTTDLGFLITFGVCILVLVPFLIYTFVYTDVGRVTHGHDDCGNVCGKNNPLVPDIPCSGENMVDKPFLEMQQTRDKFGFQERRRQCTSKCDSDYFEIFNRCFPKDKHDPELDNFGAKVLNNLRKYAGYVVLLAFIGLCLTTGMLMLFRHFTAAVVWVILVGSLLGFLALTIYFWSLASSDSSNSRAMNKLAITFSVIFIIATVLMVCMLKRIQLVIQLFKEAANIIFEIPLLLFEPLLTVIAKVTLYSIFLYFLILMGNSGILQSVDFNKYDYVPNPVMFFTMFYHTFIVLWMGQFIIGCQHMVVSGAVSSYYFSRNKSGLNSPIYTSFVSLIRYHLGTVAVGSLIIATVTMIKIICKILSRTRHLRFFIQCCMGIIEDFLRYWTKNAYIQTALHGQPFCKSGKRAVRLLVANALSTIAINSVGDFVLIMAQALILVVTAIIGMSLNYEDIDNFIPVIVVGLIVTLIITYCFFSVFETAIDTIYMCYCEDSCMNDGVTQQYYMTINLMRYMEDAKATATPKK